MATNGSKAAKPRPPRSGRTGLRFRRMQERDARSLS